MTLRSMVFVSRRRPLILLIECRPVWLMSRIGWDRLLFNPTKTEVLWCSSRRRQHLLPTGIIRINNTPITPVSSVRNVGVHIECDTAMKNHVTTVVRSCFAALRQIRSVRRSLPRHALITLIRALVVSKIDHCNLCWLASQVT